MGETTLVALVVGLACGLIAGLWARRTSPPVAARVIVAVVGTVLLLVAIGTLAASAM